jgi:hypothetical protein
VICPDCQRVNAPHRRYCGRCGGNLAPVCRRCDFHNERDDRFCGGCGELLVAASDGFTPAPPHAAALGPVLGPVLGGPLGPALGALPAPVPADPIAVAALAMPDELSGLFAPALDEPEPGRLPEGAIAQDDLDRLFGAAP